MRWRSQALFVVMCVVWGSTWIAARAGLDAVPPSLFVGSRFVAAGALLVAYLGARGALPRIRRADLPGFAVMVVLMTSLSYGLLFWGAKFVSTGMAAVLDLALLPMALLVLGVLLGEERFSAPRLWGIGLGVAGLLLLFGPVMGDGGGSGRMMAIGGGAIVVSALLYGLGSVLARPLLRHYSPVALSGLTMLPGGVLLVLHSLLFEAGTVASLGGRWGWAAWLGWGFLVLFGSVVAYTIFLHLVAEWGPAAAGSYAFVSPVVAVLLGAVLRHETVSAVELAGMASMLAGAFLTLRRVPDQAGAVAASSR